MKLFSSNKKAQDELERPKEDFTNVEALASLLKVSHFSIPEGYVEIKKYPLNPPFSYAVIVQNTSTSDTLYMVDELPMNMDEKVLYNTMKDMLERTLTAPTEGKAETTFQKQLEQLVARYKDPVNQFPNTSIEKVRYYLTRDIVGFGPIDPFMYDPGVEDISCGGVRVPLYVWHRNFESIKTNISFNDEEALNDFVMRMVHRAGKHVSAAFPVTDLALQGNHRMAILYQKEITPKGSSFTIRKFKEEPYTIIDLINLDTLDINIAAYLWLMLENKMSIMVLGPTASGKTTLLNAITSLMHPAFKIFTVEDVAEINIPHENWFALVARSGFGLEHEGEIGLYDLIKAGVRHRPDYIVVGEVRGEEAYVLFQALATGHGGLCTMHADSVDSAIKRLMQKPMNIPPAYIPMMNCTIIIKRVRPKSIISSGGVVSGSRRVTQVSEIISENRANDVFAWDAKSDTFNGDVKSSNLFQRITRNTGLTMEEIIEEYRRRILVLQWMVEEDIHDYNSVSSLISTYYQNPESILQKVTVQE